MKPPVTQDDALGRDRTGIDCSAGRAADSDARNIEVEKKASRS
jgi:hypothetical protein